MTQERMIRINNIPEKCEWIDVNFMDRYANELQQLSYDLEHLELAPPKDWKPPCYDEEDGCLDWFNFLSPIAESYQVCKECIYRKKE